MVISASCCVQQWIWLTMMIISSRDCYTTWLWIACLRHLILLNTHVDFCIIPTSVTGAYFSTSLILLLRFSKWDVIYLSSCCIDPCIIPDAIKSLINWIRHWERKNTNSIDTARLRVNFTIGKKPHASAKWHAKRGQQYSHTRFYACAVSYCRCEWDNAANLSNRLF